MLQKEQQVVIYSDEASMASGNGNGDSLNPIASPSAVEEVSNVLVPQIPVQTAPPLFDDRRVIGMLLRETRRRGCISLHSPNNFMSLVRGQRPEKQRCGGDWGWLPQQM